jgi:hypothetical protein
MLDLLTRTDPWALAQICVDHIQPTKTQYLAILRQQGKTTPDGASLRAGRVHRIGRLFVN